MMDYLEVSKRIKQEKVPKHPQEWLAAWRELAAATSGIESKEDPRYEPIMRWLDVATTAELLDDWTSFCEATARIKEIMRDRS